MASDRASGDLDHFYVHAAGDYVLAGSAVSVTASGALEGLGKGTHSLVISLFRYVILMIPAAFVLCRIFGPTGVWHAFWITEAVTSVIAAYVYHKAAGSRK